MLAVFHPFGGCFTGGGFRNLFLIRTISIHDKNFRITFVFADAVIGYTVQHLRAIRRNLHSGYTPKCPKHFRRHSSVFNFGLLFPYNRCFCF